MMKAKHRRLIWILIVGGLLALSTALILTAFDDNLVFFYSPQDLQSKTIYPHQRVRLGGLVLEDSFEQKGMQVHFTITDRAHDILVSYEGVLPDLFREGQGVVVEGYLKDGHFEAKSVLAKHDENYMPAEVARSLKQKGVWRDAQ